MRGWTRKEAILKGLGIGLAGLAAHYETGFSVTRLTPLFAPRLHGPRVERVAALGGRAAIGFVATVACRRDLGPSGAAMAGSRPEAPLPVSATEAVH